MSAQPASPEAKEIAALKLELALANLEIAAIKRREETYVQNGDLESMVPWFDMPEDERERAIDHFGPEARRGRAIYPVEGAKSVADIRLMIAKLRA